MNGARRLATAGQHSGQPYFGARADRRVAINMRHGYGCRLDASCVVYVPTVDERALHEHAHQRDVRPERRP